MKEIQVLGMGCTKCTKTAELIQAVAAESGTPVRVIKETSPEMAAEEQDIFSDMAWEDVLSKVKYLEHFSEEVINVFKIGPGLIKRIVVQVNKPAFNFLDRADYQWFINNTNDPAVSFFKGEKSYEGERNSELFDLIRKGSVISDGSLYESIINLLHLEKK